MRAFFKRNSQNAVWAAVFAACLSVPTSLISTYFAYKASANLESIKANSDRIQKFETSTGSLTDATAEFVAALNENKDLTASKVKLRSILVQQMLETNSLKDNARQDFIRIVAEYQNAITDFNQLTQATLSVADVGRWAEKFGKILDLKKSIVREMRIV